MKNAFYDKFCTNVEDESLFPDNEIKLQVNG